ncbi:MAG: DUF2461 domain-containing protein [Clostridiaceae bacterium]|nr:DUF2461 domain-containing protein [Eubacteriales bacterium]
MAFQGFTKDTYVFFMEVTLHDSRLFMEQNRARYKREVQQPLNELALGLLPDLMTIDANFNPRPTSIVSRIYRDTRYTKNKALYRDHAWLSFKHPDVSTGETFSMYAEIDPRGYGYGMGMYSPDAAFMRTLRERILANPLRFLELAGAAKARGFTVEGDLFKRDRFPDADESLKPYLNRKGLSFCFYSHDLKRTMRPEFLEEVREGLMSLKELYWFIIPGARQGK